MRFAAWPLARLRMPALFNCLAPTGDYWPRASPFHGQQRQLPLYCLIETGTEAAARQIACHQDIASDGCFSLAMIAEYMEPLQRYSPWFYPRPDGEAGIIGQLLYIEAEAAGTTQYRYWMFLR
jgi:hypothetical protein